MDDERFIIKKSTLTGIADAIREKIESSNSITVSNMASIISNLEVKTTDNINDPSQNVPNTYIENNGTEVPYNGWSSSGYIPIDSRCTYTLDPVPSWHGGYDANKNYVFKPTVSPITKFPDTIKYLRVSFATASMNNFKIRKIYIGLNE